MCWCGNSFIKCVKWLSSVRTRLRLWTKTLFYANPCQDLFKNVCSASQNDHLLLFEPGVQFGAYGPFLSFLIFRAELDGKTTSHRNRNCSWLLLLYQKINSSIMACEWLGHLGCIGFRLLIWKLEIVIPGDEVDDGLLLTARWTYFHSFLFGFFKLELCCWEISTQIIWLSLLWIPLLSCLCHLFLDLF